MYYENYFAIFHLPYNYSTWISGASCGFLRYFQYILSVMATKKKVVENRVRQPHGFVVSVSRYIYEQPLKPLHSTLYEFTCKLTWLLRRLDYLKIYTVLTNIPLEKKLGNSPCSYVDCIWLQANHGSVYTSPIKTSAGIDSLSSGSVPRGSKQCKQTITSSVLMSEYPVSS